MSSAHDCVQSVRKNIREDMEDRWVTNLSRDSVVGTCVRELPSGVQEEEKNLPKRSSVIVKSRIVQNRPESSGEEVTSCLVHEVRRRNP